MTINEKQGSEWTREDVRVLKNIFRDSPNVIVAMRLGRTTKAVERKASKLGLNKTKKYLKSLGR